MPFVPHFALRDLFGWTVALALLAGLSAFLPWELGPQGRSVCVRPRRHSAGVVLPLDVPGLKYMPAHVLGIDGELVAIGAIGLGAMALVFLPFLDRNTPRSRAVITWAAVGAMVFMIAMTVLALRGGH